MTYCARRCLVKVRSLRGTLQSIIVDVERSIFQNWSFTLNYLYSIEYLFAENIRSCLVFNYDIDGIVSFRQ
jgi:hypothetical protein